MNKWDKFVTALLRKGKPSESLPRLGSGGANSDP